MSNGSDEGMTCIKQYCFEKGECFVDDIRLGTVGRTTGRTRFATMGNEELEELLFAVAREMYQREEELIHDLREIAERAQEEYRMAEGRNAETAEPVFQKYINAMDKANHCQDSHYDRWYRTDGIYADVFNAATGSYGRGRAMKYLGNEKK